MKSSPLNFRPCATYRLQFNRNFTFSDAREILEYLAQLGITHCYASPLFQAAPRSEHGYNICAFGQINCELGTPENFEAFATRLKELGMGLLLDVVPNHMAADPANPWWRDVLEKGDASRYAAYFDIDWSKKLLVPILGDHYGKVLERGELKLAFKDTFCIDYFDKSLPLGAEGYPTLLRELDWAAKPDLDALKKAAQRFAKSAEMEKLLHSYRDPAKLHALLQQNPYRLAYWRTTAEELNYRRFFDVTELVGLRMEAPEVFEAVHKMLFGLIEAGKVTGLRIDHPDGLRDPAQYFERLHQKLPGLYVVAEKILMPGETLPEDWPIAGTTGYDFLNLVNGIFVDDKHQEAFTRIYQQFSGCSKDYQAVAYESKKKVLILSFQAELHGLAARIKALASRTRFRQDLMHSQIFAGLVEVISCFPVYRNYVREGQTKLDSISEQHIEQALADARVRNRAVDPGAYDFIQALLLLHWPPDFSEQDKGESLEFIMRFQQLTGPAMAKGMEDTAFYNFNRLLSLNEVGGSPGNFGVSLDHFHRSNAERLAQWSGSMLATATHDTKRGEDARARINVLSEIPNEWEQAVLHWREINARHKVVIAGQAAPTANDEYFLYQTLVGAWPSPALMQNFTERITTYMLKAVKEAKANTSWTDQNEAYENAVKHFVGKILKRDNPFMDAFLPFQRKVAFFGQFNSLAQTLLKCTCPGVPDFYQGTELWDFSLVDPDNRRHVDFTQRRTVLSDLTCRWSNDKPGRLLQELLKESHTGQIKMFTTHRALQIRREHRELFERGEYVPLQVSGVGREHICAFMRQWKEVTAIVVVPRFSAGLTGGREIAPIGEPLWGDTFLSMPELRSEQKFVNAFTKDTLALAERQGKRGLTAAQVLNQFPVALLVNC